MALRKHAAVLIFLVSVTSVFSPGQASNIFDIQEMLDDGVPQPRQQPTQGLPRGKLEGSEKVEVVLYEEALCPYCCNFVQSGLKDLFTSGLISIVNLRLVPYGNAQIAPDGSIACQHGEVECTMNLVESCAIHLAPSNTSQWFFFIECLDETAPRTLMLDSVPACAARVGIQLAALQACYTGPLGDQLVRANAAETDALDPPHQYVPWLTINGVPAYENYANVAQLVCNAYKGPKPDACSAATHLSQRSYQSGPSQAQLRGEQALAHKGQICAREEPLVVA
eukprot:jgi/Mesen1/3310/ME000191S02445